MTARLLPDDPQFESSAERSFAEALRDQLPGDAVIICNQRFTDESEDREADLIVGWPGVGIAVIEVKGGAVEIRGREWRQTGGRVRDKRIHPVDQARTCMYLLRRYLGGHRGWGSSRDPRMAFFVAVPATDLPSGLDLPELPRSRAIGSADVPRAADRIRAGLLAVGSGPAVPTADDVRRLEECLLGAGLPPQQVLADLRERGARVEHLTGEQARVLDQLALNRRVEVRGGPGSGKTWLALEKARRLAEDGQRVALLCYSRGLAEYLRRRADELPARQRPAYVGTFHGLGTLWGLTPGAGDDDRFFWDEVLPALMADAAALLPDDERFDAVVVDEAQDFGSNWWTTVTAALRDPDQAPLYMFTDGDQQVFHRDGETGLDLVPFLLTENLRNTKQIAGTFSSLQTNRQVLRGGSGAPVVFVECAMQDAVARADAEVRRLREEGWPPGGIGVVTTRRRHPEHAARLEERGADGYWASFFEEGEPFYGHVAGVKGLEWPAVVLAVDGFNENARAERLLHVGLSRARDLLIVCGDLDVLRRAGGEGVHRRLLAARRSTTTPSTSPGAPR
ncbi:NERD domain-containing protein [Geodermatophilus sp. SYSU D01119]